MEVFSPHSTEENAVSVRFDQNHLPVPFGSHCTVLKGLITVFRVRGQKVNIQSASVKARVASFFPFRAITVASSCRQTEGLSPRGRR